MKPNLQDYPKFYRWLTLPFCEKTTSCAGPSKDESNLDVRHARHLRSGLLLAVLRKLQWEKSGLLSGSLLRVLSCLASFVIGSMFRDLMKWEIQPLLEKIHPDIPFPADMFFGHHYLHVCLPVVASAWNVLHAPISSISPCPSSWGFIIPRDVLVAWGLGLVWGGLFCWLE